ncbi:hypothetical protein IIB34_04285 [PVC group bacterium]|nr:hypothetical protein [PVC group bacterium]
MNNTTDKATVKKWKLIKSEGNSYFITNEQDSICDLVPNGDEKSNGELICKAVNMHEAYRSLVLKMGHVIRLLDNDIAYQELWTLDGEYMNEDLQDNPAQA